MADLALDILARDSPHLLHLTIFPSEDVPYAQGIFDNLVGSSPERLYDRSLSTLTHLVELTCTVGMLRDDVLSIVGSLPQLRRFSIYEGGGEPDLYPDEIPEESFPALRDLGLIKLDAHDATSLLSMPPLLQNLTHFRLKYLIKNEIDDDNFDESNPVGPIEDEGEHFVSEILSFLKSAPKITHLDLDVMFTSEDETQTDIARQELADILSGLQLKTFILMGGHIWNWTQQPNTLQAIWPNVTVLKIAEQITYLGDLICFSHLPSLEYLLLGIVFEKIRTPPEYSSVSPLRTLECSNYNISEGELRHIPHSGGYGFQIFKL
ncbi:hypothetical protein RhiJN_23822 [Ceratobasidium sp. AG-Ba]|nr:hypothetical protein RhiJN_23822 [Ceratobasidium sp. AG-Ba]